MPWPKMDPWRATRRWKSFCRCSGKRVWHCWVPDYLRFKQGPHGRPSRMAHDPPPGAHHRRPISPPSSWPRPAACCTAATAAAPWRRSSCRPAWPAQPTQQALTSRPMGSRRNGRSCGRPGWCAWAWCRTPSWRPPQRLLWSSARCTEAGTGERGRALRAVCARFSAGSVGVTGGPTRRSAADAGCCLTHTHTHTWRCRCQAIYERIEQIADAAGQAGINILCLQEAW